MARILRLIGALLLLTSGALAQEEPVASPPEEVAVEAVVPAPPPMPVVQRYRWGGIGIPTLKYNTTDGLGFGAGGELYERPVGGGDGYRHRISLSTFWTTSGNYGSNWLQVERRGRIPWVTRFTWALWRNMVYVGSGGEDVAVRNGEEAFGNTVNGPSLLATVNIPVRNTPLYVWVQGYARYAIVKARPGGPLDQRRPFGIDGGLYVDVSAGLLIQELDRYPVPNKGVRAELSVRGGGSATEGTFLPIVGVNAEWLGWWPLVGEHLTLGFRSVFDKTWGQRPFFEQEFLAGQLRDEVAYEQMLTGYSRSRTRGDGVAATMIELRPFFGRTRHPTWDVGFYLSTYAEIGWLFKGDDPGPPLPTVGIAPLLVWQGAVELRPFLAWGWMSDVPGGPRTPEMQIGVSLLSPL